MRFEWDEAKNRANRQKHGLDFRHAEEMFLGRYHLFVRGDVREHYEEERWSGLGMFGDTVAVVIFTNPAPDTIRVISLRKAKQNEKNEYYQQAF